MKWVETLALLVAVVGPILGWSLDLLAFVELLLGLISAVQGPNDKASSLLLAGIGALLLMNVGGFLGGATGYVYAVILLSSLYALPQVFIGAWKEIVS